MSQNSVDIIKQLADDPNDVVFDNEEVLFTRRGHELTLKLSNCPGIGLAVSLNGTNVPINAYIQKHMLDLPSLANQITKITRKKISIRPSNYIEAPSTYITRPKSEIIWVETSKLLLNKISNPNPFATQLIELTARAGQGKTALLDELSIKLSGSFQPDAHPVPLLLTVDLLGRYIGSIDDAIAGTLNNTFMFPNLTQKDVVLCMKNNWMVLALDGFDELVARIGPREAFIKINELVEQLQFMGTLIISARDNFFKLYNISSAIQTYLKPRVGSYDTSIIMLNKWSTKQGCQVFSNLGSKNPNEDYCAVETVFSGDNDLLSNPFFLTKVAQLWLKGDRLNAMQQFKDQHARIKYILETYIIRESDEKWTDRDGKQIISSEQHNDILGYLAKEMWRLTSFKLIIDELTIATQIATSSLGLSPSISEAVINRIATHAALQNVANYYSFIHEQFFSFYLGYFLLSAIKKNDFDELLPILLDKELIISVQEWFAYNVSTTKNLDYSIILLELDKLRQKSSESVFNSNIATMVSIILPYIKTTVPLDLSKYTFSATSLSLKDISNIRFVNCNFWDISFEGTVFSACNFINCIMTKTIISSKTSFNNVVFDKTIPSSLVYDDEEYFIPSAIKDILQQKGISFPVDTIVSTKKPKASIAIVKTTIKIIRWSNRFYNMALEELVEEFGPTCKNIVKTAIKAGVFKDVDIDASGSKKTFVRVVSDRDSLIQGHLLEAADDRINLFWDLLGKEFPFKE